MSPRRLLMRLADSEAASSLGTRLRRRRLAHFRALLDALPRPLRVIDLGGTARYWELMGLAGAPGVHVTLVNLGAEPDPGPGFVSLVGDARHLPAFADGSFDVVFSNSVIEHVGALPDQRRMAREVRRLAPRYYVQTPNRHFPVEPHFLFPGWQFLPEAARVALLRRTAVGWYPREPDPERARAAVREIRLLTRRELMRLFPGAEVREERFLGLVKSFTVFGGW